MENQHYDVLRNAGENLGGYTGLWEAKGFRTVVVPRAGLTRTHCKGDHGYLWPSLRVVEPRRERVKVEVLNPWVLSWSTVTHKG